MKHMKQNLVKFSYLVDGQVFLPKQWKSSTIIVIWTLPDIISLAKVTS